MLKISRARRLVLSVILVIALAALIGGIVSLSGCTVAANNEECTHENTYTLNTATCEESGIETVICTDCGTVLSEKYVAAYGHDYVEDSSQAVAPTCVSEGKAVYVCSRCGGKKETVVEKIVHDHDTYQTTNTATCTEAGVETVFCLECNVVVSETTVSYLGHEYVLDASQSVAATCTSEGLSVYICTRCGDKYEITEEQKVHSFDGGVVTDPTCTEQGYTTYTCTDCGYSYADNYTTASHDYQSAVTPATCTTQGYTTYTCSKCQDTYTADYVAPAGHTWNTDAACLDKTCTVCQATEKATASHTYVLDSANSTAVTCTTDGESIYVCSVCSDYYTETIAHTGHTLGAWTDTETVPVLKDTATCTYTCEHSAVCSTCQETVTDTYESVIHKYVLTVTKTATCQEAGTKQMKCTVCGGIQEGDNTTVTYYADHTYGDGVDDGQGNITYTCSVCSNTKVKYTEQTATVTAEALQNDIELGSGAVISMDDTAQKSLSSETNLTLAADSADTSSLNLSEDAADRVGSNQVYSITLTDDSGTNVTTFNGGSVTVKLPYTLAEDEDEAYITIFYINDSGELETITNAVYDNGFVTFTTTHFSYYSVGKYTRAELCERYGHITKTLQKTATCTESGYNIVICTRCGETLTNETNDALDHAYNETTVAATCTTNGSITKTCTRDGCGAEYTAVILATGHNWELDEENSVAATCTNAGYNSYTCANCGETYKSDILQLSHSYTSVKTEPTCTAQGYTTYTCTMCGTSYVSDYLAAKGHNWDTTAACLEKTCLSCGITQPATAEHNYVNGVCSICGKGCDHTYLSTVVQPTCTEYGYTLNVCTKCGAETKTDYVSPTGHVYTTDLTTCDVCGYVNDHDMAYIFNTILESCYSTDYTLSLSGASFVITQEDTYNEYYVTITYKIDDAVLYFTVTDEGTILVYGTGALYCEYVNGENSSINSAAATIYGDGEYLYVYASEGGDDEYLARIAYEYALGDYYDMILNSEETLTSLESMLEEYLGSDLYQNILTIIDEYSATANELGVSLFEKLFLSTQTEDGYKFTFDMNVLAALNNDLYELTVSELLDKYVSEGILNSLINYISGIENTKVNDVITELLVYGADYGITKELAFTAIDTAVSLATGTEFSIESLLTDSSEEAQAYGEMTMGVLISEHTAIGDYSAINSTLKSFGKLNVYEQLTGGDADIAETIYNAISKVLSNSVVNFYITTDSNFNVTSVNLSLTDASFSQTSYYGVDNGSSGSVSTTYSSTFAVNVNGTLSVLYSCNLPEDSTAYKTTIEGILSDVVDSIKAACANSDDGTVVLDMYYTFGVNEDGTVYVMYTEYTGVSDWEEFGKAYEAAYEAAYAEAIAAPDVDLEELTKTLPDQVYNEVYAQCSDKEVTLIADITTADFMRIAYNCTSGYRLYICFDNVCNPTFYIDTANNIVSESSNHNYVESQAPEGVPTTMEEVDCGEYYYTYYTCTKCGDTYYITHYKEHYTEEVVSLVEGATSCQDGVREQYICVYCGEVIEEYVYYWHYYTNEVVFTLTCNSTDDHNGTIIFYYETCLCGEYSHYWYSDNGYGCGFNEYSKAEYLFEDGSTSDVNEEIPEGKTAIGVVYTYPCYYTGCKNYYTYTHYYCSGLGGEVYTYYQYESDGSYSSFSYSVDSGEYHTTEYQSGSDTEADDITVNWWGRFCVYCEYGYKYTEKFNANNLQTYYGYEEFDSEGNVTYSSYTLYEYDEYGNETAQYRYVNGVLEYKYEWTSTTDEDGVTTSIRTYTYADATTEVITEKYKYDSYDRLIYRYYEEADRYGNVYWYYQSFEVSEGETCYGLYQWSDSYGNSDSYYEYQHSNNWTYFNNNNGTCTQPYTWGYTCSLCSEIVSYQQTVNTHNWVQQEDGTYVCWRCGLESENGSSSYLHLEDLTDNETYGRTGYVAIGYYSQQTSMSYINIGYAFVSKDGTEVYDIEFDEDASDYEDTGSIIYISLEQILAWATEEGISLDDYDFRVLFYDALNYDETSITLTDLATTTATDTSADSDTEAAAA